MPTERPWGIYLRILLTGVLIAMLNLASRPHALHSGLEQAYRAMLQGEWASALDGVTRAAEQAPWRIDLPIQAARLALQNNQPQLAIQILQAERVSEYLSPDDWMALGDAFHASGDTAAAAEAWQRVAEAAPSPEIYRRLADLALADKDYPTAVEHLRRLLQYSPADAGLSYRIGLLYATFDPDAALAYLAQAAEIDPSLAPAAQDIQRKIRTARLYEQPAYTFTAAGRALALLDEWDYAEAAFTQAVNLRPDYAEAWAFLGEARQHTPGDQAQPDRGLAELQRALELDPASISANLLSGLYYERQGDYPRAVAYIQNTLSLEPDNPLLQAELANALALQGDLPAAQAAYENAIALAPEDPLFYRLLAEFALSYQIQYREIALPAARSAVVLAPDDPRSLDVLGHTLLRLNDYHSAERLLVQAIQADPEYAAAHLHLGMVLVQRGEMERARQEFDLADSLGSGTFTATQAQRFLAYYFP